MLGLLLWEKKLVGCIISFYYLIFDVCVGMQLNIIFFLMRIQCRPFVSQTIFFIKNVFARAIFEIILENDKWLFMF
jgi:hypothetical protein